MEDLIQKIDDLIKTLNANAMPLWISIVGIFIPILLSAIVIIITIYQHKKNKALQILINEKNEELQKKISDKELRVQMHGDILSIYDGNCMMQNALLRASKGVAILFANPNLTFPWYNELLNALHVLCQANNRAFLLLPQSDSGLREVLNNLFSKIQTLFAEISDYINSGAADLVRQQTWNKISPTHNIPINNYNLLSINYDATVDFIKLCTNKYTEKMDNEIRDILELFKYDKFDKYFEPYLRMYSEEKIVTKFE